MYHRLLCFTAVLLLCLSTSALAFLPDTGDVLQLFPDANPPERILAMSTQETTEAERLLAVSLQGLAVRSPIGIYLVHDRTSAHWLSVLEASGVEVEEVEDLDALIAAIEDIVPIPGFIRTQLKTPAVNAATSLAALVGAAIVDESLVDRALDWGWDELTDATGLDDRAAWELGDGRYASHVVFQQDPNKGWHLRDAVIASGGYVFYDPSNSFYDEIAAHADPNAPLLGWGAGGEDYHVGRATRRGFRTIPADWSINLSVFGRFSLDELKQNRPQPENLDYEPDVHYVAFIMSDGDNIQWVMGDIFALHEPYFGSPFRGEFPMGWQMSPGLIDAAPHALAWLYDSADNDEFVMGVSGTGYLYPSMYPEDAFIAYLSQMTTAIRRTDMPIATILDHAPLQSEAFERVARIFAFAAGFQGGIYLNYSDYAGGGGDVLWVNETPFISARFKLWDSDPVALAGQINALPRTPSSTDGYTVVSVHPWSHTLEDVHTVVAHLDDHVQVVLPSELVARVRTFARPE